MMHCVLPVCTCVCCLYSGPNIPADRQTGASGLNWLSPGPLCACALFRPSGAESYGPASVPVKPLIFITGLSISSVPQPCLCCFHLSSLWLKMVQYLILSNDWQWPHTVQYGLFYTSAQGLECFCHQLCVN